MNASVALPKPPYVIGALPLLAALIAIFVLGAVSGYLVKPSSVSGSSPQAVSVCPAGSHVVVWYTARVRTCLPDASR